MNSTVIPKLAFAALFALARFPIYSQVGPSATIGVLPLSVGLGLSAFNPDFRHGILVGGTFWIDYTPNRVPQILRGIGVEAEARDLSYNRSSSQPANLREDVASGGVIYSSRYFNHFRPYVKFLMGYGNIDYMSTALIRAHDSRTVTTLGGGAEYRVQRNIWLRGDYEYQFWPDFWKNTNPSGSLTPEGFTLGASYDFSHPRRRSR